MTSRSNPTENRPRRLTLGALSWCAVWVVVAGCGQSSGLGPTLDDDVGASPVDAVGDLTLDSAEPGTGGGLDADVAVGKDSVGPSAGDAAGSPDAGEDGVAPSEDAGGPGDDVVEDVAAPECPEPAPFGCPCLDNDDCASGWCVPDGDGLACTRECDEACDPGWTCSPVEGGDGGSTVFICVPLYTNLCRPCATGADCTQLGDTGGFCIPFDDGAGSFCGGNCQEGGACPDGFECADVTLAEGVVVEQCLPETGACECNSKAFKEGASTSCSNSSPYGVCEGTRLCGPTGLTSCDAATPLPEVCNGVDDDCDGQTDEDQNVVCYVANDEGTCFGFEDCVDGQPVACDAKTPAPEDCDGADNDCNGLTDEGYQNLDGDALADCVDPDVDGDGVEDIDDNCPEVANEDQANADEADELAEGVPPAGDACDDDDDGDGVPDAEDCSPTDPEHQCTMFFYDEDEDTYGKCSIKLCLCEPQGLYTVTGCTTAPTDGEPASQDCDDEDPAVHPGAEEPCDGLDNDCDGVTDQDHPLAGAPCDGNDEDVCKAGKWVCAPGGEFVVCEEAPGSTSEEVCDGADNDCDDAVDEGVDGGLLVQDCYSGLTGTAGEGLCQAGLATCMGATGFGPCVGEVVAAEEICDGADNDCDGLTDEELGETTCGVGACKKTVPNCVDGLEQTCEAGSGGGEEVCDGVDNDCDGFTDGADLNLELEPCELASGVCAGAQKPSSLCVQGAWQPCDALIYLVHDDAYELDVEETCDGLDNDCDGDSDEDFALDLLSGETVTGVGASCGAGVCSGGLTACNADADGILCDSELGFGLEACNGEDDDCDGLTDSEDDQLLLEPCELQTGACAGALKPPALCVGEIGWATCIADDYLEHSAAYEADAEQTCDGVDNDCDGVTDEGVCLASQVDFTFGTWLVVPGEVEATLGEPTALGPASGEADPGNAWIVDFGTHPVLLAPTSEEVQP